VNSNKRSVNVENNLQNTNSIRSFYKQLIVLRKQTPALVHGLLQTVSSSQNTFVFYRKTDDQTCLVIINMDRKRRRFNEPKGGKMLISNYDSGHSNTWLRPYEIKILQY